MKNIIFYARLVKYISYFLMLGIVVGFISKWFSPELLLVDSNFFSFFLFSLFNDYVMISEIIPTMPLINRLLGMLIDGIAFSFLILIFSLVVKIMKAFECNEIFSLSTVGLFTSMSKCVFYFALYMPINRMILSVITTLHVRPHTLSISFSSTDLLNIFIFGFFMVMTLLMKQAMMLQHEQNLTV